MYSVSENFKLAINQPSRELKSRITINNTVIDDFNIQSIMYSNGIVAGDDFEIGTAIMASAEIKLIDTDYTFQDYRFEDKECKIEIAVKLADGTFEYIPLGLFTIEKVTKSDMSISLSSVDRMYKFEKDYISTLAYPATLLQIAQDICSRAGVTLVNTTFPNATYMVNHKPVLDKITLRKAISQIAELAGGYCRVTRDGRLEIFNLNNKTNKMVNYAGVDDFAMIDYGVIADELVVGVIDVNRDNYINLTNKDLSQASIDKVIVKLGSEEAVKGAGENPIYIVNNIFCQNPNLVVEELYNALNGLIYTPFESKWIGNPAIDCGDMISINTGRGLYNTFYTSRTLTYRGGLREECKAVGKSNTEKKSTGKGNLTLDMENALTIIEIHDGEIKETVKQGDFESYKKQTAQEISQKVSDKNFESFQSQTAKEFKQRVSRGEDLKTEVTQNADSWKLSIDGKLSGKQYIFDGNGFSLIDDKNKTLITPKGVASCDTIPGDGNVEGGKPLVMKFYIDDSVNVVDKILLRFAVLPFRAFSKGAAAGGGVKTTQTGGGVKTSGASSVNSSGSTTSWGPGWAYNTITKQYELNAMLEGGDHVAIPRQSLDHVHNINHYHDVDTSHYHEVDTTHIHDIVYGIYEKPVELGSWSIVIDGALRSTVTGAEIELDLTQHVSTKGWHTIEITSGFLNRIIAALYVKSYVQM